MGALSRRDFLINLRMRSKPFIYKKTELLELPLPLSRLGIPYLFTIEFFSRRIADAVFSSLLKKDITYLLIHPADFASPSVISDFSQGIQHSLERSEIEKTD